VQCCINLGENYETLYDPYRWRNPRNDRFF
jgi:hypothetical protein